MSFYAPAYIYFLDDFFMQFLLFLVFFQFELYLRAFHKLSSFPQVCLFFIYFLVIQWIAVFLQFLIYSFDLIGHVI